MNSVATETTAEATATTDPVGLVRRAERSLVIGQLRANPFRVLRLGPDAAVDQALWRAEEVLVRLRAGVALDEPDLLPWLREPDEPEVRQAIQRIEEPLRRLADELAWFDPDADPDGELLRRAVATLEPAALNQYLARCRDDGLPRGGAPAEAAVWVVGPNGEVSEHGAASADGTAPADDLMRPSVDEVPRLINQANLRVLLATLALYDALPDGLDMDGAGTGPDEGDPAVRWSRDHGMDVCEDPHALDLSGGQYRARSHVAAALWRDAVGRWLRLACAPAFLASVRRRIERLGDEVVGDDDAEAIVAAATTRITDLVVGEVKAQLLAGRLDRVAALMEAAASGDGDPRRWSAAFRQLRPLFRTAAAEIEPLLPQDEDRRLGDAALYLSRLGALLGRWRSVDPTGLMGLGEVGDEAVAKACQWLRPMMNFRDVDRLKALHTEAAALAAADSLKQKIAAAIAGLENIRNYGCHFCGTREMAPNRSIVATCKRESHRTYGFNSTTIHYILNATLVPRCPRCADLHESFWENTATFRAAFGVAAAASVGLLYWMQAFGRDTEAMAYVFLAGLAALAIWVLSFPVRWISAWRATPKGERRYWTARASKAYRELEAGGGAMTIDYRRDAYDRFDRARKLQGG
jgi:hypothetical protein